MANTNKGDAPEVFVGGGNKKRRFGVSLPSKENLPKYIKILVVLVVVLALAGIYWIANKDEIARKNKEKKIKAATAAIRQQSDEILQKNAAAKSPETQLSENQQAIAKKTSDGQTSPQDILSNYIDAALLASQQGKTAEAKGYAQKALDIFNKNPDLKAYNQGLISNLQKIAAGKK